MKPRVLFLNRSYWPDAEATGQLLTDLCEGLAHEFDVTVVAGTPNANPSGQQYHRRGAQRRNDVNIQRLLHTRFPKSTLTGRGANLISFAAATCWRLLQMPRPNIVVAQTDPFLLPLIAATVKHLRSFYLIAYVQDIYPDVAVVVGKAREGFLTRLLRRRLARAYRRADWVVTLSSDMRDLLVSHGVAEERVVIIPNWADTEQIYPKKQNNILRNSQGLNRQFVVMYSGNMGLVHDLDSIVRAAELLRDEPRITFLFVGEGSERARIESEVKRRQLDNVRFMPYQPRENLADSLSAADLHVVSLRADVHRCVMPSKLYGVLATGTPVVAIADGESELTRLVREKQVGITVAPGDAYALEQGIRSLFGNTDTVRTLGINARNLAVSHYDSRLAVEQFRDLLHRKPSSRHTAQKISNLCARQTAVTHHEPTSQLDVASPT